ncbi:lantibiotic dehydratase [Saccharopolyspora cebuensis]|uniref:lantibiotic dehydratase n=1 Tax=Saccharopolyspora cebuensis TaxID=418759 RepID=UPI0031E7CBF1
MDVHVEPTFVVRVAGLPLEVLDRLRTPRTAALVEAALDAEQWLDEHQEELSDALHEVVGATTDTALRRRLLTLRRDVHRNRAPRSGLVDADLLGALPGSVAAAAGTWHRRVTERDALVERAAAGFDAEADEQRHALHDIATAPDFRRGLVLASEDLRRSLSKAGPHRADRKLERKLAKYLARMASKTSPYSTFTGAALGRWAGADESPRWTTGTRWRSVVELNAFTQQQIPRTLASWPEVRPTLPVAVNSSAVEDDRAVRFLGRDGGEALLELPASATLRRFLAEIGHGDDRTWGGVVRALSAVDGGGRDAAVGAFLDRLIDMGLVEIGFGIPDDADDPLGRLVDALARFPQQRVVEARRSLAGLRAELDGYGGIDGPDDRRTRAASIDDRLREVYDLLGWTASGEEFPKNAFYEDVLITEDTPVVPPRTWRETFGELDLVRRLAGLYDRFLPGRIAAEAFFADHFGVGARVPLLDFYGAFSAALSASARPDARVSGADLLACYERAFPVPRTGLPRLDELADWQEKVVAAVAGASVDGTGVRRWEPDAVRALLDGLPEFVRPIESLACYLQPVADGAIRERAVLNELMTGFGRSRARLLRLGRTAGVAGPPAPARRPLPGERVPAEVTGTVGSNLNLTHPATHYEISYPASTSDRPPEQRIPLGDLVVAHDPAVGELRLLSRSRGFEVLPVHLGVMVEFLLPAAHRFLLQMFGQAVPRFEFVKQLATAAPSGERDGVRRHPRLALGGLVLNRAAWSVRAADLPRRENRGSVDHLLAVNRWRRRHGLPHRCFVRAIAARGEAARRSRVAGLFDKTRKPVYVDFSSELFLNVFEEVAGSTDQLLVFEEALPGPAELLLRDEHGRPRASEFVVEVGRHG